MVGAHAYRGSGSADFKLGAPAMFAGRPYVYRFKDCEDGISKTFLVRETVPIYRTFMMYFSGNLSVASTNPPPNYFKIYTRCPKASSRVDDCFAHMRGFNSLYPGGGRFVVADGLVHCVNDDIDYALYQFLGSREDGQMESPFG